MARQAPRRRSSHHGGESEHGAGGMERWLLTYADMLTLLFALFIMLYAISSVNTSKFNLLKNSLQEAFSGKILPGGSSVLERGASEKAQDVNPQSLIPTQASTQSAIEQELASQIARQDVDFARLKRMIDAEARRDGLADRLETTIARRGLVVRLLTDRIAFDSGSAVLKPAVQPLLRGVGRILATQGAKYPAVIEGYTDSVPVRRHAAYPTNWELSSARASSVARFMIRTHSMRPGRLSVAGYAYLHALAPNSTAAGRSRNRRVEIVLVRPGLESAK